MFPTPHQEPSRIIWDGSIYGEQSRTICIHHSEGKAVEGVIAIPPAVTYIQKISALRSTGYLQNNRKEARVSTRGVIARQKGDSFEGRYHHWDSYPTGLGKALWELSHNQFKGDIEGMLHILIDGHPAGWSTIVNKDFSLAIGFNEFGKGNCLTCGKPSWEHYYQEWESHGKCLTAKARREMANCNYMALGHSFEVPRSTNAECYCHGDRKEDELLVNMKNAVEMGCEYAYAFSTNGVMTILSSINGDGSKMIGMFGMGNPEAKWGILAVVPLDGQEPDWHSLQGW